VSGLAQFRRWVVPVALGLLLLAGLIIRLALLDVPGHYGDSVVMTRWAEAMAQYGPWHFYEHDGAVYPALLYVYWPLGVLFDGAQLAKVIKGVSIPFDLALGVVVYVVARRMIGSIRALIAPAIYLLNPSVLLAGPVWGQVDAAGTLAYLLALLAVVGRRWGTAGALGSLAILIKPQFGLVVLPIGILAVIAWRETGKLAPIVDSVLGGILVYAAVALPLRLDPISFVSRAAGVAIDKPVTSAYAPNLWSVLVGYGIQDAPYALIGVGLLLLGLAASLVPLRYRRDLPTVLAVGLFMVLAFYILPTRIHERYLFPAIALLAPFAATSWRVLVATLVMSAVFTLTLLYALATTTSFALPKPIEDVLLTRTAVIWIAMTLMATSATLVVLLLRPGIRPRVIGERT
jgi:dolichyl-phosphate-mannose-protein mannosyltransferase